MRSGLGFSALLAAVMQGRATQLCQLVAIGPLHDGSYRCFTDLDRPLTYNPTTQDAGDPVGSRTFHARTGMDITAISSASDLSVDNAEMETLPPIEGSESEGFTTADFIAGGLDYADVRCYIVDFGDLSLGHILLWGGKVGEVRRKGIAQQILEWRSRLNQLKQIINKPWSRDCIATYLSQPLGTGGGVVEEKDYCGLDGSTRWNAGAVSDTHPTDTDKTFFSMSFSEVTGTFNRGMVHATSGANAGFQREIESYTRDGGTGESTFELLAAFPYDFAASDTVEVRDGCDKSPNACRDVTRWGVAWVDHFRGFPYMPLGDAGVVLVGGPAVPGDLGGTGENPTIPDPPAPTPPGGNDNPGSPTARTINTGVVVTPSLLTGSANAAANSTAINNAIATLTSGGILRIPANTEGPWYINTANPVTIDQDNVRLDLATNGATLQAAHTSTVTAPATHRDVVRITGATEVEVVGGRIIGYRDSWTSAGGESAFGVSEWAHGIFVTGSSSAVTIKDCTIPKCVGDSVSVGFSSNDVWIDNCELSYSRRQGVSNGGDNLKVTNCYIHHISGASNGPCAGIDCEPDDPAEAANITITGNVIEDCSGPGVLVWLDSSNITIEDNTISRCSRACLINEGVTVTFKGNVCRNNRNPAKFQNGSSATIGGATADSADRNEFFQTGSTTTSGSKTTLHGESAGTARHLDIDNTSSASVLYNIYGPT